LREGKNTLPLIIAMQRGTPAQRQTIQSAIENGEMDALAEIETTKSLTTHRI